MTRRPVGRPATMKDVAAEAGVSIATVSRTLNGDEATSLALRTAVLEAAQRLQYRPSAAARRLRTKSSSLVGVVVQSVGDGYIGEVVLGIQSRARELGYQPLFFASEGREALESEALEVFLSEQVRELISVSPRGSATVLQRAVDEGLHVAVINWDVEVPESLLVDLAGGHGSRRAAQFASRAVRESILHITFDDVGAAAIATNHLLDLGHRRFVHLRGPNVRSSLLRLLGYRRALETADLWPQPVVVPLDATMESRELAIAPVLAASPRPVAVVAYDDMAAVATLRAAHRAGRKVPEDVSVVGIDDIQFASYMRPALTTVAQPKQDLGALAVDAVLGRGHGTDRPAVLDGRLIVRESTAPVARTTRPARPRAGRVAPPVERSRP